MTLRRLASRHLARAFAALLLARAGLALAGGASPATEPASTAPPGSIASLIGDAACADPGECRVIGIGAKPCGGPGGYLAWSTRGTDASALRAAVDAQAQAQTQANADRGVVSDCRLVPEPTAVCRPRALDGKTTCQLVPGRARSAI